MRPSKSPDYHKLSDEERKQFKRERAEARARRHRFRPQTHSLFRLLHRLVSFLPLRAASAIGAALGGGVYVLVGSKRERVLEHLTMAFGDEKSEPELRTIARQHFIQAGRGLLSLIVLHRMGPERAFQQIEVRGVEHLDEAVERGKGCIVVACHYGLFDLSGAWLGRERGGAVVGKDAKPGSPTAALIDVRAGLGVETIQRGSARDILRKLKKNKPVAIVADHDVSDVNGVFVRFFGRLSHTPQGAASLAIRTGAPISLAVTTWDGPTRHVLTFHELMHPNPDLPKDEAELELTARYTHAIENAIRAHPDHWMWFHRRWRQTPETRPDLPVYDPPATPDQPAARGE